MVGGEPKSLMPSMIHEKDEDCDVHVSVVRGWNLKARPEKTVLVSAFSGQLTLDSSWLAGSRESNGPEKARPVK